MGLSLHGLPTETAKIIQGSKSSFLSLFLTSAGKILKPLTALVRVDKKLLGMSISFSESCSSHLWFKCDMIKVLSKHILLDQKRLVL